MATYEQQIEQALVVSSGDVDAAVEILAGVRMPIRFPSMMWMIPESMKTQRYRLLRSEKLVNQLLTKHEVTLPIFGKPKFRVMTAQREPWPYGDTEWVMAVNNQPPIVWVVTKEPLSPLRLKLAVGEIQSGIDHREFSYTKAFKMSGHSVPTTIDRVPVVETPYALYLREARRIIDYGMGEDLDYEGKEVHAFELEHPIRALELAKLDSHTRIVLPVASVLLNARSDDKELFAKLSKYVKPMALSFTVDREAISHVLDYVYVNVHTFAEMEALPDNTTIESTLDGVNVVNIRDIIRSQSATTEKAVDTEATITDALMISLRELVAYKPDEETVRRLVGNEPIDVPVGDLDEVDSLLAIYKHILLLENGPVLFQGEPTLVPHTLHPFGYIRMPPLLLFSDAIDYLHTFFHEVGHWAYWRIQESATAVYTKDDDDARFMLNELVAETASGLITTLHRGTYATNARLGNRRSYMKRMWNGMDIRAPAEASKLANAVARDVASLLLLLKFGDTEDPGAKRSVLKAQAHLL